jgi:hypothetical protein
MIETSESADTKIQHTDTTDNTFVSTKRDLNKKFWEDRRAIENERVRLWREKQAQETVPIKYEQSSNDDDDKISIRYADVNEKHTTIQDYNILRESVLCAAFGTASTGYSQRLFQQTLNAQFLQKKDGAKTANDLLEALVAMNPKDIIEGQLCSRLLVLVNHYNEYMQRATDPNQPIKIIEKYLNCATKLMRTYNETLDLLNKHRRKGEQRVTVQHVNVTGGQTVVAGQFTQGVGDQGKK